MWNGQTVSVVLPTYAERLSIRRVIEGFFETGLVDEVVVIDNNAEPGTREEVAATQARLVVEPRQGYGHAIRRGLLEADGELIVVTEPDGTFLPQDISKLLVYSDECDAVFGTRTTRNFIWRGANMPPLLRWGNWGVAKLVEALFNTNHLSDVGCTYKLFHRDLARHIAQHMAIGANHAAIEIMLITITSRASFIELPVNYLPRVGRSSVTGNHLVAIGLGLRMVREVLRYRLRGGAPPYRSERRPPLAQVTTPPRTSAVHQRAVEQTTS